MSQRKPSRPRKTVETDQAAREASGAHPYGRYLEEFEVGDVYKHWPAKTVTESDDHLFCLITMNHHPLHINDVYAHKSQQGRNVVVGPLVYSLALGMSVSDVSGKAIANLATEELKHPAPVFHGDTLFCESEVLEKKESRSKPDRGTCGCIRACSTRTGCSSPSSSGWCSCRGASRATSRRRATSSRSREGRPRSGQAVRPPRTSSELAIRSADRPVRAIFEFSRARTALGSRRARMSEPARRS